MKAKGHDLVAQELVALGVKDFFYLIGGPMMQATSHSLTSGIRGYDFRDERGATFAAVAYARLTRRPGVVMTCSGPGTTNTLTGVAHAYADGSPVIVIGGSTAMFQRTTGAFQETDQVGLFRPITKWSHQVSDPDGIPDALARAFEIATSGAPGPVYIDLPSDVLFADTVAEEEDLVMVPPRPFARAAADPAGVVAAIDLLTRAEKPVVIAGSGVLWSEAWGELEAFVDAAGIPFYTTPMTSGLIAEDHALSFQAARSTAFRETDCLFVIGTRDNYVLNMLGPPVVNAKAKLIELNIHAPDLSRNRLADVALLADAKLGLAQLTEEIQRRDHKFVYADWTNQLSEVAKNAAERAQSQAQSDMAPVHPLRLATELNELIPRDTIFVLDGNDTLSYGRRGRASYRPGGMLTPGVYGTMGVGIPFGIGAKIADPSAPVVVLTGDGAAGYHLLEVDTAARHGLGFVCVISNNGGWTSKRGEPGYDLGYSDYHNVSEMFGCFGVKVSEPSELKPAILAALDYAKRENKPAVVNVLTEPVRQEYGGRRFASHSRGGGGGMDAV